MHSQVRITLAPLLAKRELLLGLVRTTPVLPLAEQAALLALELVRIPPPPESPLIPAVQVVLLVLGLVHNIPVLPLAAQALPLAQELARTPPQPESQPTPAAEPAEE